MATNKTNLQIIITKDLEERSKQTAVKLGFNNVPEMVRSMLVNVTNGPLSVGPFTNLSPKKEAIYEKEVQRAQADFKTGKAKAFDDVDKMIEAIEAE